MGNSYRTEMTSIMSIAILLIRVTGAMGEIEATTAYDIKRVAIMRV